MTVVVVVIHESKDSLIKAPRRFPPAAGYFIGGALDGNGEDALYWSRSTYAEVTWYGGCFYFSEDITDNSSDYSRYYGASVRPVRVLPE